MKIIDGGMAMKPKKVSEVFEELAKRSGYQDKIFGTAVIYFETNDGEQCFLHTTSSCIEACGMHTVAAAHYANGELNNE